MITQMLKGKPKMEESEITIILSIVFLTRLNSPDSIAIFKITNHKMENIRAYLFIFLTNTL